MKTQPVGTEAKTLRSVEGKDNPHPWLTEHGVEQSLQPLRVRPTVLGGVIALLRHGILQCRPGCCWEYRRMAS